MDSDEFQSQIHNKQYNDADVDTNTNNSRSAADALLEPQHHHQLFRGWHNSSRIFRVSRASAGKDRHSKVWTSKGLRDRRVRLSVSTAIQFYDLQDRLGYDQPSKAVEWLIEAAADSIAELPSLHCPFPDCDDKLGFHESAAADSQRQQQQMNLSASSTSETSKGSGLSLTRTDARVNQRVKARERAKEKQCEISTEHNQAVTDGQRRRTNSANPVSSSSTFTELLTGGDPNNSTTPTMMDYFTNAALISAPPGANCLFLGQTQMGIPVNNMPPAFHLTTGEHHLQQQHRDVHHFSFDRQNLIPSGNEGHQYDLNFTISSSSSPSGLAAGFNNRGTLQSNSPTSSMLHRHRYNAAAANSMEGSNVPPFFMTTTAASSSAIDNTNQHRHYSTGLDGSLHLYHEDRRYKR